MTPIRIAILTVSDRCSHGQTADTSGPALADLASTQLQADIVATACLPDERAKLSEHLRDWAMHDPKPDLILTTGGTGLAPRDLTPEATLDVIERRHAGLRELIRRRCYEKTPRAYLSRGEAGTLGRTLIINLPGSQRGATESLEALLDILPHAIETLRGEVQDDGRSNATSTTGKVIQHKDTR
jgi:molybdenum cofactor synthesis domain-containing protein